MKKIPFGNTGLSVAPLGIGATDSLEVITCLLDAGANLVDTAQCYGDHEAFLGATISHRRDEFILQSKCGHHQVLPDGSLRSREISMADVEQALNRLKTDHLDIMLLHSYDHDLLQQGDAIDVLESAKTAGKIRFVGYSGDNESAALAASLKEIDVIETSISIADQCHIQTLLNPFSGKAIVAKRPVANAAWRFLDSTPDEYADLGLAPYVERLKAMCLDLPYLGFPKTNAGWSELALRFNLSVKDLHTSIVSTKSVAHAIANLDSVSKGPLANDVFEMVRTAFQEAGIKSGNSWRGQN